ncbi:MAG: hypothetical protein MZV63_00525 [Marinilabiliales bacterium]|nr:hypothetical protein [Marinilabiliales bacterium]
MNTMLHELGHGVYSYYNDMTACRSPSGMPLTTFTTEAIANLFRTVRHRPGVDESTWGSSTEAEETNRIAAGTAARPPAFSMLVFSRWAPGDVPV